MKVLLIWEEVPENTKLFLLDGELGDKAIAAHGCYINMVDGDPDGAADALNEALEGVEPLDEDSVFILEGGTAVVRAGFLM